MEGSIHARLVGLIFRPTFERDSHNPSHRFRQGDHGLHRPQRRQRPRHRRTLLRRKRSRSARQGLLRNARQTHGRNLSALCRSRVESLPLRAGRASRGDDGRKRQHGVRISAAGPLTQWFVRMFRRRTQPHLASRGLHDGPHHT